jgi:Sulfotransferase family
MPRPIFIIGSPRSGTSALTWALGQHPNISLQPESNWIPGIAKAALEAYKIGTSRGDFSQLSNAQIPFESFVAHFGNAIDAISRECFERHVERFAPRFRGGSVAPQADPAKGPRLIHSPKDSKKRWVDGTPEYTFSTYELSLLFPDCQFIHILRRPNQVANSLAHFENVGADGRNFGISSALGIWLKYTLAAREAAKLLGRSRLLRIDNEDLLNDGKAVLRRCFEFLGEEDCECGTLALNVNMNSSKASDRQAETDLQIKSRHNFQRAMELYEELRYGEVPAESDPAALTEQRERFEKPIGYIASIIIRALCNK